MGIKIEEFHRRSNKGNSGNIVYCTPRGRDSSYFGLFSIIRVVWLCFFSLRGCLGKFWNEGMLLGFDPT